MPVEINQIIRSKRKTIALIVRPDASVIVRAPLRASNQSIRDFIEKNIAWIEKKQAQARAGVPPVPKKYEAGESFEYLGIPYPLETAKKQEKSLILENGRFMLVENFQDKAGVIFERWYREQARAILDERVNFFARRHGFHYTKLGITAARTRWGSCSASGSLSFSWRLIQAPLEVVDYVVVHELVHTVIHNHSRKFWKRVEQIMPEYEEHRKWLRQNGHRLLL